MSQRGPGLSKDQPLLGCPGPAHVGKHAIAPWLPVTHWEVFDTRYRRVIALVNYYGIRDVDVLGRHEPLPDAPEVGPRKLPGQRRSDAQPLKAKGDRWMPPVHVLHT